MKHIYSTRFHQIVYKSLVMLHETYKLTVPDQDIRYLYFPRGRDYCYYEMEYIPPLHHGEDGYSETDSRVRGLPLLTSN